MKSLGFSLSALSTCVAAVLLSGCGGNAGSSGATPQGAVAQSKAHRFSGSWMLPGTSGEDLIYVSSPDYYPPSSTSSIYVFSYPGGSLVGTLTGFQYVEGLCADSNGDVWITNGNSNYKGGSIYEYAHGATIPKATLEDTDAPWDCTWEPSSGNLAVSGESRYGGSIAVYPNASGEPTYYSTVGFVEIVRYITYDGSGNLYFASNKHHPAWLPEGSSSVMRFGITPRGEHVGFQWDGKHFTVLRSPTIEQYSPSGGHSRKPVGSVKLNDISYCDCYDSIEGSLVAVADGRYAVHVYDYPQGGNPTLTISGVRHPLGVAISVPPPGKRIRK
jgi:hypothetical protein